MHFKHKDLNRHMNKWMDTCMDRWVSGWLCGRRKSLRKSIKFSGEQLWHSNSSLLLSSIAPLPGAHPISPVLQGHLSVGEMVQESVSWRWQELIDHRLAGPAPLGANHSSMGWRLQDRELTCHTSTCLTGPSSRVLAKGVPNHVALLSQHWTPCQAHSRCSTKVWWVENEISWSSLYKTNRLCISDTNPAITSS